MGPTDKASKIPEKSQAPQSSQSRPSSHARARRDSAVDSGDGEPPSARPSMRTASSESKDGTKTYRSTTRHGEASRAPFVHPLKQPHCWKTLFLIHRASFHLIFQKASLWHRTTSITPQLNRYRLVCRSSNLRSSI